MSAVARKRKITRVVLATGAMAVSCGHAVAASHLEPCNRLANYEERVERIMRDAWPEEMELLAIMYVPLTERGIGIRRHEHDFDLIRLEFDKSFWYSSWRRVDANGNEAASLNTAAIATDVYRADGRPLGAEVLDFSGTQVRVAKSSIPISNDLGVALVEAFEHSADAARVETDNGEVVVDGYAFEILLTKRPCVELRNPPPASEAGRIAALVRFLDGRLRSWQPWERDEFEAEVQRVIPK